MSSGTAVKSHVLGGREQIKLRDARLRKDRQVKIMKVSS